MWQVKRKQEVMKAKKEFGEALSKDVEAVSKISLIASEKRNS